MEIKPISSNVIEISSSKTHLIIMETSQGELEINPKRPAIIMASKLYHKDAKKKSILGSKYDYINCEKIQVIATMEGT